MGLRPVSPMQVLALQRTAGNHGTAGLLRSPGLDRLTPTDGDVGTPVVQRLLDRADLERLGGVLKHRSSTSKQGAEYRAVLDLLDHYHQQADALTVGPGTTPQAIHSQLVGILDRLKAAGWDYIGARRTKNPARAAVIEHELLAKAIPQERKRIEAFVRSGGYADPAAAGRSLSDALAEPVKIDDVKIHADNGKGGSGQLGHRMDISVDIDAGKRPRAPANAAPHSIYGVQLEYWEKVEDLWDFQDENPVTAAQKMALHAPPGKDTKQWNDIYALKPAAATFSTNDVPGSDVNWVAAVAAAGAGTLRGRKKVGFTDYPGIWMKPNRYYKRVLRFRIVIRDGSKQREIYATQVLDERDGALAYSAFTDNQGGHLEAAGYTGADHADRDQGDVDREQRDIDAYGDRLRPGAFGAPAELAPDVPLQALQAIRTFVNRIVVPPNVPDPAFGPFDYKEKNDYIATNDVDANVWESILRPGAVVAAGNTAGTYMPPAITGQAHQYALANGTGLLVAIMHGNAIWKMYYTTVATQAMTVRLKAGDPGSDRQLKLRRYHEIPMEMVEPWAKAAKAPDPAALDAAITAEQNVLGSDARVAGKIREHVVANQAAKVVKVVKQNYMAYDVMAAAYRDAKATTDTTLAAVDLDALVLAHLVRQVRATQTMKQNFRRLGKYYKGPKLQDLVKQAIAQQKGKRLRTVETKLAKENLDVRALERIIRADEATPAVLRDHVMAYLRSHRGLMEAIEVDYRTAIANLKTAADMPVGWDTRVPADLGPLSYDYFVGQFQQHGGSLARYRQMYVDFPTLEHRIKPAYRFVFGDKQLKEVASQMRTAGMLAKYDPSDPANLAARHRFVQHAPFSLRNFVPSTTTGKFDADYNPRTGILKITVKVAFEFADADVTQLGSKAKIKDKEVAENFGKSDWGKNDKAKAAARAQFRTQVLNVWAGQLQPIVCTRPGWEGIQAIPSIDIQEVAPEQAHHIVQIHKAVLSERMEDVPNATMTAYERKKVKGLKSTGTSGYAEAKTNLKEFDVADKINDPAVHRYLHKGEKTGNVQPAYTLDRTRQDNVLQRYGTLAFQAGGPATPSQPGRIDVLVQELKRLDIASSLSYLHPIKVEGDDAGNDQNLARQRAAHVAQALKAAGILNPIRETTGGGHGNRVIVSVDVPDPQVLDTYVNRWSRISAAHEFGHMIGLIDEYYRAQSNETVRQMISDGWLPPDTPADHFTKEQTSGAPEAEGQKATARLFEANDLTTPDFTMADNAKSTSLMTGGAEVTAQHHVTLWEALARMTAAEMDGRHWRIG